MEIGKACTYTGEMRAENRWHIAWTRRIRIRKHWQWQLFCFN